jgi:hypothetical protein
VYSIPANTESLLIFTTGAALKTLSRVTGGTTGKNYPFTPYISPVGTDVNPIYVVPVAPAVDDTVTIAWGTTPTNPWYVVADAGVRMIVDSVLQGILGAEGGVAPTNGIPIMGVSNGDTEFVAVDTGGRLLPTPATILADGTVTNGGTAINAPTSGAWWITGFDISAAASDSPSLLSGGVVLGRVFIPAANEVGVHDFTFPVRVTGAVTYGAANVNQSALVVIRGFAGP